MTAPHHKSVLMIAYHFPPFKTSSGLQRTVGFCKSLPNFGWHPTVLTASPKAYRIISDETFRGLDDIAVYRAFARDTSRHLAIGSRYSRWLALPDEWVTWWFGGVASGVRLIRRIKPAAIWSTYPIATAHLIGLTLHRLTSVPWIADLRDPMAQDDYPVDPRQRSAFAWIERNIVRHAAKVVFVAPGALRQYSDRFPDADLDKFDIIENGYDEEAFSALSAAPSESLDDRRIRIVHSGLVYPDDRDPTALFEALSHLKSAGEIDGHSFQLNLRASGHEDHLEPIVESSGATGLVTFSSMLPYEDALAEMTTAGALLILQGKSCNNQIPAKIYEYLRARRPILGLADPAGDTYSLLQRSDIKYLADIADANSIVKAIRSLIQDLQNGIVVLPAADSVKEMERGRRTAKLAQLLDEASRTR